MKPNAPHNLADTAMETDQASRLLRLGLLGPSRPVDRLLDRLSEPDGPTWLATVLSEGPLAVLASVPSAKERDAVTLAHLTSLKEIGKTSAVRTDTRDGTLRAMVGYFFAIGSALALFGENISSRSPDELNPIMMDLASVSPPEWSGLFEQAWSALSDSR